MTDQLRHLCRVFLLAVAALMAGGGAWAIVPSDCRARDADSTCNSAVQQSSGSSSIPQSQGLYDGPLAGVPSQGYSYWGFDYAADANGVHSDYVVDLFVNHTPYQATIRLSFTIPIDHGCGNDCIPGVQFYSAPGWHSHFPNAVINGSTVYMEYQVEPFQAYGWVIGLWQSTNPRLRVTVPNGVNTTLVALGLPPEPGVSREIAPADTLCMCGDGIERTCSLGSHFSNGLDGPWYASAGNFYVRAGAYTTCPPMN